MMYDGRDYLLLIFERYLGVVIGCSVAFWSSYWVFCAVVADEV